jgi:hypothetical protein
MLARPPLRACDQLIICELPYSPASIKLPSHHQRTSKTSRSRSAPQVNYDTIFTLFQPFSAQGSGHAPQPCIDSCQIRNRKWHGYLCHATDLKDKPHGQTWYCSKSRASDPLQHATSGHREIFARKRIKEGTRTFYFPGSCLARK